GGTPDHRHPSSLPGAGPEAVKDRRGDLLGGSDLRLSLDRRAEENLHAPAAELLETLHDRGVLSHQRMHRRRDEDRYAAAQGDRGAGGNGRVVDPVSDLRDRVRGRRRDQVEVRLALSRSEERDVLHAPRELQDGRVSGRELNGLWGDEAGRLGGHHGADLRPVSDQLTNDLRNLDRGDRARDPYQHPTAFEQPARSTPDGTARMHLPSPVGPAALRSPGLNRRAARG